MKKIISFIKSLIFDPLNSKPFIIFSRHYYGNLSGMKQNLYGNFHLSITRFLSFYKNFKIHYRNWNSSRTLKNHGFVSFNVNKKLISNIDKINLKIKEIEREKKFNKNSLKLFDKNDLQSVWPEIASLFDSDITQIIRAYYRSNFKISDVSVRHTFFIKNRDPKKEYYSDFWHNDSSPSSNLSIFVLLKDTFIKNGPMQIINKNDSKNFVRKGYKSRSMNAFWTTINNCQSKVSFTGNKGKILIANVSDCLHRATSPKPNNERLMLVAHTFPVLGKLDKESFSQSWIYNFTHKRKVS